MTYDSVQFSAVLTVCHGLRTRVLHDPSWPAADLYPLPAGGHTMSAKHTPRPWTLEDDSGYARECDKGGFVITDAIGRVIASRAGCPTFHDESQANARLIAAAPDLLAFVENIALWTGRSVTEERYEARALLARIDGEP